MSKKFNEKIRLDRRSRKLQNKKYHKRKKRRSSSKLSATAVTKNSASNYIRKIIESHKEVPKTFSFTSSPVVTIDFFNDLVLDITNKQYKKSFFINSSEVEFVTVDALIYLIAIMHNIKINIEMHYTFRGNLPENEKASIVYRESGFMTYVESKLRRLPDSTNKMKITSGNKNDPQIASQMCKFVMDKLNKKITDTLSLHKILIELMSNVYHHAYNNTDINKKQWYVYAELIDDYIHFVFVDTGAGIARTVRKNIFEKIGRSTGALFNDGDLIFSTLKGDFRTETKETHRGNGLSGVKDLAASGLFRNFTVISGSGSCVISDDASKELVKSNYNNSIFGTIFTFDVV
ncbi:ATP-binding protein [Lacrimispora sp. JR3]|uniref:ATP-binding protein n=1 Tax=Lacrimispora sinapis TaxID=3111456 RepID=UPI003748544E